MMNGRESRRIVERPFLPFIIHHSYFIVFLMLYLEIGEFAGCGGGAYLGAADITVHSVGDGLGHLIDFFGGAFEDQFHPTVRQVSNITTYVEPHCEILNGVAETDALNATGIMNVTTMKRRRDRLKISGKRGCYAASHRHFCRVAKCVDLAKGKIYILSGAVPRGVEGSGRGVDEACFAGELGGKISFCVVRRNTVQPGFDQILRLRGAPLRSGF
jgi:hypothetical protein